MVVNPFLVVADAVLSQLNRIIEAALSFVGSAEEDDDGVSGDGLGHTAKLSGKGHLCWTTWASKSERNWVKKARADHEAPSASAQMHLPSMKLQQSASVTRSWGAPSPRSRRASVL